MVCCKGNAQRIGNYVANGSFEEHHDCSIFSNSLQQVKHWLSIDSLSYGAVYNAVCNTRVPFNGGVGFQYPKTGNACVGSIFYWPHIDNYLRGYLKNRLKSNLQVGKTYCVKFYINVTNESTHGIDGIGAYFGGSEIDTITKCTIPLSYIAPQVQNPQGNIITDTLNWVAVTGTFTANGTEKYLVLGNFLSDEDTDTLMINPTNLPAIWSDVLIDDVSCIEIDLLAYAGRDTTIFLNDSVYIGREKDFATDSYCVWYKLPDTANAIDTISGLWVKPSVTTTYVVKQELECSSLKWDTVVVSVGYVGLNEYAMSNMQIELYPNPAQNEITIKSNHESEDLLVEITDVMSRKLVNTRVKIKDYTTDMEVDLLNGVYFIRFTNTEGKISVKKLTIAK
ncbi:MAG: T9SS type A sorting domain-containing protein [Bacteroidetes bacterium]|nr:T9SS type A sorting domain-containing protein [Bacteroidota bacterium]